MNSKKKSIAPPGSTELHRNSRWLLRLALIVAGYLIAFIILDFITKQFEGLPGIVTWYPPAGLTYALLLVFGVTFTPAVTIALFISSLFTYRMPQAPYLLLLWAFVISLIYGLAAAFLRKRIRLDWHLRKLRDVAWFIFTTVAVSALLAVLSVSSSALTSAMPRSEVLRAIFDWWIGETVGVLTVTPFLLIFVMPGLKRFVEGQPVRLPARRSFPPSTISAIGQAASIALTLYLVFGAPALAEFHPLFLISLPLIWIALTRGFNGISLALLALNSGVVLALWLFRFDPVQLGELELLMIVNCIVGLLMGAVVTERKQATETLQKSEKRFRALIEHSIEEISLVNSDGTLTWESPTIHLPLGYPPHSLVGHNLFDLFHPDERAAATRLLEQIGQHPGSVHEASFRLRHQDGSWHWIEGILTNLLDEPAVKSVVINYRDVTDRKLREEEIRSRTDELTTLYQLSRTLSDANDLENVIELVNRQVVENVHTTFGCIALLEEDDLVPRAVYPVRTLEHDFSKGGRQPIASLPVCQNVLEKNEPVILQSGSLEVSHTERALLLLDFAKSVCLVPLRVGDSSYSSGPALGLLILGEARQEKREPFTPEKIRLARSIGDQAASAIRRLLLSQQTGRRLQQLTALSNIDRAISSTFDLHISLGLLLEHVTEQLGVDATDVLLFNQNSNTLEFSAGRGFRTKAFEHARLQLGEGDAGQAALKREIIHITNLAIQHDNPRLEKHLAEEQFVSYYGVPLISKGQIMGVLEVFQRTPLEPDQEWLDFLGTMAGQAAIAIDSVMQFENVQRSNSELSQAYDATIEGWSHALDLRDKETEGHTQRVTEMTVKLAHSLGLGDEELMQVRWGALLHDIGKMGVPDDILLKPGPLTDEEWLVMKKHPDFAYEMLAPIHYLKEALDIPYCHHEKWDGTGYPRGLKGEQIPLAARIFAVVDVWDALISDRPYRKAWSEEKAREHIRAGAGSHFDPQVVKTFFMENGLNRI